MEKIKKSLLVLDPVHMQMTKTSLNEIKSSLLPLTPRPRNPRQEFPLPEFDFEDLGGFLLKFPPFPRAGSSRISSPQALRDVALSGLAMIFT